MAATATGDKALADWDISRDAPYFGIRDPRRAGQVLLRLARRADRLPRQPEELLREEGHRLRRVPARPDDRADPLHRQGHHLLPHPVLAGDAASSRASRTRCPTTSTCTASSPCRGEKMSKSRGTGIDPLRYLDLGMNPEWLRYYIAAKLNADVEDIDFNPDDFIARVNSDLVGKYVNIASRARRFHQPSTSTASCSRVDATRCRLLTRSRRERRDRGAVRGARVRQGAARGDGARRRRQPVRRRAQAVGARQGRRPGRASCRRSARARSRLFRVLTVYLAPVLPRAAPRTRERFLDRRRAGLGRCRAAAAGRPPHRRLQAPAHPRRGEAARRAVRPCREEKNSRGRKAAVAAATISIDDFNKLDLRVARIARAEHVEGADKLLKLTLDARRTARAPCSPASSRPTRPEKLEGRLRRAGGEPRAAQDEVRRLRRHGAGRLGRRTGDFPPFAR